MSIRSYGGQREPNNNDPHAYIERQKYGQTMKQWTIAEIQWTRYKRTQEDDEIDDWWHVVRLDRRRTQSTQPSDRQIGREEKQQQQYQKLINVNGRVSFI